MMQEANKTLFFGHIMHAKRKTLPALTATFLIAASMVNADEGQEIQDPSKPTSINTRLEFGYEYKDFEDGSTNGPRLTGQFALTPTFGMEVGASLLYPEFDSVDDSGKTVQLSDTRVRALWTPESLQKTPGKGYFSGGVYLDSFIPTGKEINRVGNGATTLAPGLIAGFGLNDTGTISVWPIASYVSSIKQINCEALANNRLPVCDQGGKVDDELRASRIDLPIIFNFPAGNNNGQGNQSLTVWPSYTKLMSHDKSSATNLELNYQYMLTPKSTVAINFVHAFDNREANGAFRNSLKLSYSIFL